MNRVQVRRNKNKNSSKTIGLIIPTTTRDSSGNKMINPIDDLIFFKILLPSFLKCASNTHYYNFFLGYDHDDPFYSVEENRDLFLKRFEEVCPKIYTLTFVKFGSEIQKGDLSTMWSVLADQAVKTNEYLYQLGDDIQFESKGWEDLFITLLKKQNNIGAVGPKDRGNSTGILTQSFVHCTHLSIFKRYFPKELKNWYIDDWISEVYDVRVERRSIVKNTIGTGFQRYQIEDMKNTKDKIVREDRELIGKIKKNKVMRFRCNNNFICLEQDMVTICGNNFSKYCFKFDGELDSQLVKQIHSHLTKPEISFFIKNKLCHRVGNHIVSVEKKENIPTVQNIENVKLDRCDDDIYLFQQFYIPGDQERYKETKECLKRNTELGLFKKIYLINERFYTDQELGIKSDLITQIVIGKRLTYKIFLYYAIKVDGFCLLSNSDIFFDRSIDNVRRSILRETKSVQCLRRYEFRGEKNLDVCKISDNHESSQDTWILHSSKISWNKPEFDFPLGTLGCDNRVCQLFKEQGYTILNSYIWIKTYHNHKNENRESNRRHIPGPYCYVVGSDAKCYIEEILKKYKLFWQYPVITEKTFYDQNKDDPKYIGIPWATLIDKKKELDLEYLKKHCYRSMLYTCCQHISFRRLIPLFKILGISTLYTPHKRHGENMIDGIKIKSCPLYAKVIEDDPEYFKNTDHPRKYLYSFKGGHQSGYMSNIRQIIFKMKHPQNCYIENTGEWHFNKLVYTPSQNIDGDINLDSSHISREQEYKQLLKESRFTLCPSGSGPNSIRFWESLGAGSIPVILSNEMTLPEHKLWKDAVIRLDEKNLSDILTVVKEINENREREMRNNCIKIYNFFRNNYKGL